MNPILLDLDGTVIDSVALIRESHRHAVRTVLGEDFEDDRLVANVGRPLLEQMAAFSPERSEELYRVYREWNHANTAALLLAYPEIPDALRELRDAGRTLGIVTSKSRDAVDLAWGVLPGVLDARRDLRCCGGFPVHAYLPARCCAAAGQRGQS